MEFTDEELANEEWRPVVGWEGYYEVSSLGRVKRLERTIQKPGGGTKILRERLVATKPNKVGFVETVLSAGSRRSSKKVHHLVATAFIPNKANYRFVAHLNGIGHDNRSNNLAWVKDPRDAKTTTRSMEIDYDEQRRSILDGHTLPEEEWRDIVGYEGLYLVSNFGRVFSTPRPRAKAGLLSPATSTNGYQHVTLYKDGNIRLADVHRLVAETFLSNDEGLPVINHKDEDPTNNFCDNLEWCTHRYNSNYGTSITRRVANTDFSKISDVRKKPVIQLDIDGNVVRRWEGIIDVWRELGYSRSSISFACNRKPGREIAYGYRWDFEGVDYGKTA